jgi:nucleotide-binding universal stress UspA family protein
MSYKKILVATDFSPTSDAALTCASSLARDCGATLVIVHVEELPPPYAGGETYVSWPTSPNPEIRQRLETVKPDQANVTFVHKHLVGRAPEDILRAARDEHVDLIVMGTHGRSGLSRLLMGSVAEAVLRHATCPVLTLRQREHELTAAN